MDIIIFTLAGFIGLTVARGFAKDRKDRIVVGKADQRRYAKIEARYPLLIDADIPRGLAGFFVDIRAMVHFS